MIDLNADLGEGVGDDAAMLAIVTSASIACGGHAGDADTMRQAIRSAKANGVRIGAHPGFADPENFGRKRLDLPTPEIVAQILEQVDRLMNIAADEGAVVSYLKLHGALANMAAEDEVLSAAIFSAVNGRHPDLSYLTLAGSGQEGAARALGLPVIPEAYADRAYTPEGLLAPRRETGAVLGDVEEVVARCLRLARSGEIQAIDGTVIKSTARSVCVHGDSPGALAMARAIAEALSKSGHLTAKGKQS